MSLHTQVYLKFTVTLAVNGTSQIFNRTVSLAPNPPKLEISGPGMYVYVIQGL